MRFDNIIISNKNLGLPKNFHCLFIGFMKTILKNSDCYSGE